MRARRLQAGFEAAKRQQGWAGLLVSICIFLILLSVFLLPSISSDQVQEADRRSDEALATAKAALLAYAGSWPRRDTVSISDPQGTLRGPGHLPCPDRNDDGSADPGSCGAASGVGAAGQAARLGRLPWLTLGLSDLRDGWGNRLWYAVSSKYKANISTDDLSPDAALGTISIRDSSGVLLHDGRIDTPVEAPLGGVVAVIIAPGPVTARWNDAMGTSRTGQIRTCSAAGCDNVPANYLERAWFTGGSEDNAQFQDRNTPPRAGNSDGFIQGPVRSARGELMVNDRLAYVTYDEIQQVMMRRVAQEVSKCLQAYSAGSSGRLPFAAPVCRSGIDGQATNWRDQAGFRFGRVPVPPFAASRSVSKSNSLHWTSSGADVCTLGTSASNEWWMAWRRHVFYVAAPRFLPGGAGGTCVGDRDPTCLSLLGSDGTPVTTNLPFAVIVSGPRLATQSRMGSGQQFVANYLEASNASLERLNDFSGLGECSGIGAFNTQPCVPGVSCPSPTSLPAQQGFNDLVYVPTAR
jgi:type II secretory pathway pseudopilin PulG